jgi:DNA-binding transcriptional MerR regulator
MEYTINELGKLAGVSTRTLRYYDGIGLLKPERINSSGYRIYGPKQTERLQQIMFYRELGVELGRIAEILSAPGFEKQKALKGHLEALKERRARLDALIKNLEKTISAEKGETTMTDRERFEGFKKNKLEENERKYGAEIREKYGEKTVEKSNARFMSMTKEQYDEMERLSAEINKTLKAAVAAGDPAGELAQKACGLHKQWLMCTWDSYTKEAHKGIAQMYVADERFKAYYDNIAPGCAEFLRDAIMIYCG